MRPTGPARSLVPVPWVPLAHHLDVVFDVSDLRFGVAVTLRVVGCGRLAGGVNGSHQPGPCFTRECGTAVANCSRQATVLCE